MSPACLEVLVVDDYPDTAESLSMLLRSEGHAVRAADSGEAALELIASWQPDVAILDLVMPGVDGSDIAQRLCDKPEKRPLLVALSGEARRDRLKPLRDCQFDHHLLKPVDPSELAKLLRGYALGLG